MPYTPYNRPQGEWKGGKNILASENDLRYTLEGGTIDAEATGARYVDQGEPFVREKATGLFVPYTDAAHTTGGALNAGFDEPVLTQVDFDCDGVNNVVVGQLMVSGYVYDAKMTDKVTDTFRALTPFIRYHSRT